MPKLECPLCHQRTIPAWKKPVMAPKNSISPGSFTACPACNQKVGIEISGGWIAIVLAVAVFTGAELFVRSTVVYSAVIVGIFAVAGWWWLQRASLIPYREQEVEG